MGRKGGREEGNKKEGGRKKGGGGKEGQKGRKRKESKKGGRKEWKKRKKVRKKEGRQEGSTQGRKKGRGKKEWGGRKEKKEGRKENMINYKCHPKVYLWLLTPGVFVLLESLLPQGDYSDPRQFYICAPDSEHFFFFFSPLHAYFSHNTRVKRQVDAQ